METLNGDVYTIEEFVSYPTEWGLMLMNDELVWYYYLLKIIGAPKKHIKECARLSLYLYEYFTEEALQFLEYIGMEKFLQDAADGRKKEIDLSSQKRRHEKRGDFAMTKKEWAETLEHFNFSCAYCGAKEKIHKDHALAFSKGGGFTKYNIIPACYRCNCSKNNKDLEEWYTTKEYFEQERLDKILNFMGRSEQGG